MKTDSRTLIFFMKTLKIIILYYIILYYIILYYIILYIKNYIFKNYYISYADNSQSFLVYTQVLIK